MCYPLLSNSQQQIPIGIGEFRATAGPELLACRGLGSCVGVFLYDRLAKVAGAAHVMLPESRRFSMEIQLGSFALEAMNGLIKQMETLGANGTRLRAKLVGGAQVLGNDTFLIGEKNLEAVRSIVLKKGIYLAGEDTGGKTGKSAFFSAQTGDVLVTFGTKKYKI